MKHSQYGISAAMIVSALMWILIIVLTAVGMLACDIEPIYVAVAGATAFVFALGGYVVAIMGKRAVNDVSAWRKRELLGVFVLTGVLAFSFFFAPTGLKMVLGSVNMRNAIDSDVSSLRDAVDEFKSREMANLTITDDGLRNYIISNPLYITTGLDNYIRREVLKGHDIALTQYIADEYVSDCRILIENGSMTVDTLQWFMDRAQNAAAMVNGIEFNNYGAAADSIGTIGRELQHTLQTLANNIGLMNVYHESDGVYKCRPFEDAEINVSTGLYQTEYDNAKSAGWPEGLAWLAMALLAMGDYLLCFRTIISPDKGPKISDNHGKPL